MITQYLTLCCEAFTTVNTGITRTPTALSFFFNFTQQLKLYGSLK